MQIRSGQFKSIQGNAPGAQDIKTAPFSEATRLPSVTSSSQSVIAATKPIEQTRTTLLASAPPDKSPISQIVQWMQAVTIHNVKVRARLADVRWQGRETEKVNNVALEKLASKQTRTRLAAKVAEEKVQRLNAANEKVEMQMRALELQVISEEEIGLAVTKSASGDVVVSDWLLNRSQLIRRHIPAAYAIDRWRSLVSTTADTSADSAIRSRIEVMRKSVHAETLKYVNEFIATVKGSNIGLDEISQYADQHLRIARYADEFEINILTGRPGPYEPSDLSAYLEHANLFAYPERAVDEKRNLERQGIDRVVGEWEIAIKSHQGKCDMIPIEENNEFIRKLQLFEDVKLMYPEEGFKGLMPTYSVCKMVWSWLTKLREFAPNGWRSLIRSQLQKMGRRFKYPSEFEDFVYQLTYGKVPQEEIAQTPQSDRGQRLIRHFIEEDLRISNLRFTRKMDDIIGEYESLKTQLHRASIVILGPLAQLLRDLNANSITLIVDIEDRMKFNTYTFDKEDDLGIFAALRFEEATNKGKWPLIAVVVSRRGLTGQTTIWPPQESIARAIRQSASPALGQQLRKLPQENANPDWMAVFNSGNTFTLIRRPSNKEDAARSHIKFIYSSAHPDQVESITVYGSGAKEQNYTGWSGIHRWLKESETEWQHRIALIHMGEDWANAKAMNAATRYFVRMPVGDAYAPIPLPVLADLRDSGKPIPLADNKDRKTVAPSVSTRWLPGTEIMMSTSRATMRHGRLLQPSENSANIELSGFTELAVRAGFAGSDLEALERPYSIVGQDWSYWTTWVVAPLKVVPIWNPTASYKSGDQIKYGGQVYQVVEGYKSAIRPPNAGLPRLAASTSADRFELFPLIVFCANASSNKGPAENRITMIVPRPFPSATASYNCVQVTIERTPTFKAEEEEEEDEEDDEGEQKSKPPLPPIAKAIPTKPITKSLTANETEALIEFRQLALAASDTAVGSQPTGLIGEVDYIAGEKGCSNLVIAPGVAVGPVLVNLAKLLNSAFDVDFVTLRDAASSYCSYFKHPEGAGWFYLRVSNVLKEGIPWYGRFGFVPINLNDAIAFVRKVLLPLPWGIIRDAMADVIEQFASDTNTLTLPLRLALESVNAAGMSVCAANRVAATGSTSFEAATQWCTTSELPSGQVLIPASRIVCNSLAQLLKGIFGHEKSAEAMLKILGQNDATLQNNWFNNHDEDEYEEMAEQLEQLFNSTTSNLWIRRLSSAQYSDWNF